MRKKVYITFTEPKDPGKQKEKVQRIIAGGFYAYLKTHGYLRQNPEKTKKVQKALEKSRRLCHGLDPLDSA